MRVYFVISFVLPPDAGLFHAHDYVLTAIKSHCANLTAWKPGARSADGDLLTHNVGTPMSALDINSVTVERAMQR